MKPLNRAKRILKPMRRFRAAFKDGLPPYASRIPISAGEDLIGVYENHLGEDLAAVAVTSERLLVESSGRWSSVTYSEIASIDTPEPATVQEDTATLRIQLRAGEFVIIPICGREGKFFDLFEFSRFIARVREDTLPGPSPNASS